MSVSCFDLLGLFLCVVFSAYVLSIDGVNYTLGKDMVSVKRYQETRHVEEIIPSVIEPSFGK